MLQLMILAISVHQSSAFTEDNLNDIFRCLSDQYFCPMSGTCVWVTNTRYDYEGAVYRCEEYFSRLVEITDSKMNDFVFDIILNKRGGYPIDKKYWVGFVANPLNQPRVIWLYNSRPLTYHEFNSSVESSQQKCGQIRTDNKGWALGNCTEQYYGICETYPKPYCPVVNHWFPNHDPGTCVRVDLYNPRDWEAARFECQEEQGDLATLIGASGPRFLQDQLQNKPEMKIAWIGLSRNAGEQKFKWLDGTEPEQAIPWDVNEPDLDERKRCAALFKTGKFKALPCTANIPYICERLVDCKQELFGFTCRRVCKGGSHCMNDTCKNYECASGCQPGYKGDYCFKECTNNTYGPGCVDNCSPHCGGNGSCDPATGNCVEACVAGYTGPKCDQAPHRDEDEQGRVTVKINTASADTNSDFLFFALVMFASICIILAIIAFLLLAFSKEKEETRSGDTSPQPKPQEDPQNIPAFEDERSEFDFSDFFKNQDAPASSAKLAVASSEYNRRPESSHSLAD